jgi:hypothetical protein
MKKDQVRQLLDRVLTWPQDKQELALASLEAIEQEFLHPIEFSADDRAAFERSAEDVRNGNFASDEQVREVFDRFRRT